MARYRPWVERPLSPELTFPRQAPRTTPNPGRAPPPRARAQGHARATSPSPKRKASSTLRASQAVPHPSTDRALQRLTSEFGRDPVYSLRYGRQRIRQAPPRQDGCRRKSQKTRSLKKTASMEPKRTIYQLEAILQKSPQPFWLKVPLGQPPATLQFLPLRQCDFEEAPAAMKGEWMITQVS